MNRDSKEEEYTRLFIQFSNQVQKGFRTALILLLVGLCLTQGLLRIPAVRSVWSSAERWEGERLKPLWLPEDNQAGN
ncbi:hypothetical protein [Paenibacillus pinistramenti]|uniref:hypothetical protein n=1 Tax=Paenibacillus pinistramenti TaxID=1768003 RepID=UPI001EF0F9A7|nr:hypothetical protein [Paenibacillus pinistramenti]